MTTGTEMVLMGMLKAFLKPEQAQFIASKLNGMIDDGTFDRIGELRSYREDTRRTLEALGVINTSLCDLIAAQRTITRELAALRQLVEQRGGAGAMRGDELQGADAISEFAGGSEPETAAPAKHGTNGSGYASGAGLLSDL